MTNFRLIISKRKEKELTLYVVRSIDYERIIHFSCEIPIYGNDKFLKMDKMKIVMTPKHIVKQIVDLKLKGKGGSSDHMDLNA